MTVLLNMAIGVGAVFVLITLWIFVDQWARKTLGERNRCCHSFDKDDALGCCGKHKDGAPPDNAPPQCPHSAS